MTASRPGDGCSWRPPSDLRPTRLIRLKADLHFFRSPSHSRANWTFGAPSRIFLSQTQFMALRLSNSRLFMEGLSKKVNRLVPRFLKVERMSGMRCPDYRHVRPTADLQRHFSLLEHSAEG
jgi:hypothetical protein